MFSLLTQALLWLLVLTFLWYILQRVVPKNYLAVLGFATLLLALILPFFYPADPLSGSAWSILSLPLKPLGLSLLLLLLGTKDVWAVAGRKDGKKVVNSPLVMWALIILLLSSNPWIARYIERQVASAGVPPARVCNAPASVRVANTIVLLGRGVTEAYQPYGTQLSQIDTNERVLAAVGEYREQVRVGVRPLMIVSAGQLSVGTTNQNETEYIRTMLTDMGIPEVTQSNSVSIYESAVNTKRILTGRGLSQNERVVVVASPVDVGRAQLTFEKQGLTAIPSASNLEAIICDTTPRRLTLADFIPSAEALLRSTRAVNEFFTLIYYFMRGWLILR